MRQQKLTQTKICNTFQYLVTPPNLSVEQTWLKQGRRRWLMHGTSMQKRQDGAARRLQPDLKWRVICLSMYQDTQDVLRYPWMFRHIPGIYWVYQTNGLQTVFFIFNCRRQWIMHGACMHLSSINQDRNTFKYEKLYSKLGVVCTRTSQDILVYTGTYRVDNVDGLHIVFFTFDHRIRCKMCGDVCMQFKHQKITLKHENLRRHCFHITWDILGYHGISL